MWSELKLLWLSIRYLNKIGKVWEPFGTFVTVFDRGVVASVLCTQRFWNLLVTWAVRVVAARAARDAVADATPQRTDEHRRDQEIHTDPCLSTMKVSGAGDESAVVHMIDRSCEKWCMAFCESWMERWLRLETPWDCISASKKTLRQRAPLCTMCFRKESKFQLSPPSLGPGRNCWATAKRLGRRFWARHMAHDDLWLRFWFCFVFWLVVWLIFDSIDMFALGSNLWTVKLKILKRKELNDIRQASRFAFWFGAQSATICRSFQFCKGLYSDSANCVTRLLQPCLADAFDSFRDIQPERCSKSIV